MEHVTQVLQDSHKRGYLDEVASGHQMIIVDDNFRLSKPLKKTIQLTDCTKNRVFPQPPY